MQVNDSDDEEEVVDADKLTLSRLRLALKYEQKQVRPPEILLVCSSKGYDQKQVRPPGSCWSALQMFMNRNRYVHLILAGLLFRSL